MIGGGLDASAITFAVNSAPLRLVCGPLSKQCGGGVAANHLVLVGNQIVEVQELHFFVTSDRGPFDVRVVACSLSAAQPLRGTNVQMMGVACLALISATYLCRFSVKDCWPSELVPNCISTKSPGLRSSRTAGQRPFMKVAAVVPPTARLTRLALTGSM